MNIIIWLVLASLTGYLAFLLKFPSKRVSLRELMVNSLVWSFIVGTFSHAILGLGNLFDFSLISAHMSWSGSLLGIYLIQKGVTFKFNKNRFVKMRLGQMVNRGYQRLSNTLSI